MLDFVSIKIKNTNRKMAMVPVFKSTDGIKDLMVKGKEFYAIWDFEKEEWTTSINRAYELIDACTEEYIKQNVGTEPLFGVEVLKATESSSGIMDAFLKYVRQIKQNFIPLDNKVIFKSDPRSKNAYSSHRLPYDPIDMETPSYNRLMSVIYKDAERQKIEWLIGSVLAGDNDKIQKFGVFYGDPGTGKGTILSLIEKIFEGYTTVFEASALGNKYDSFALEPFKDNPVVALQMDGNLSRIEDNTRLNSLISHETMTVNEKFKGKYATKFNTVLFMASNNPVNITDAKSGILRRLIDIEPTGEVLSGKEYRELKSKLPFEIPGIAYRCRKLYLENKDLYDFYRPMTMMSKTNEFYDFVLEYYDQFISEEYILLSTAWTWYKKYIEDSNSYKRMSRTAFATELSSYFETGPKDEWKMDEEGRRKHLSSVYRGFKKDKFKNVRGEEIKLVIEPIAKQETAPKSNDEKQDTPDWLQLKDAEEFGSLDSNPLNVYLQSAKAQYAIYNNTKTNSRPRRAWDQSHIRLRAIDTRNEHYILTQSVDPKLICIDFDIKDPITKEKSLVLNLAAAANFPITYAETSKSGKGLHLYYIYDGDPSELSMVYDDEIEIKTFFGKSALRRKLLLCNNEKIAHIGSGLPMKEEGTKMINWDGIKNEKQIRTMIKKNLAKEYHGFTKPSVDYIKFILDSAYESGIKYDVTDLRPKVMNFAASSSNNADYCMGLVCEMHFASEEVSEGSENKEFLEKPIIFFDTEVFKNLFILCYKKHDGKDKSSVIRLINPSANEISEFVNSYRIIGFNNRAYDNVILYARILGYNNIELYQLSQRIISNSRNSGFREAVNISYTDIYDFSNKKQSLKKWEIELGIHHQEFPLEWDKPVPEEMWDLAADYCSNDVVATEKVFDHLKEDWVARQMLAKVSGLTVNDQTNAHSTRIIFGRNRNPQSEFNYPDLSKEFPGYEFSQYGIDKERYRKDENGKPVYSTGKSIFMGEDPSEGGFVSFTTGIHTDVALLDIASLHPSTIEALNLFGPYTKRFSEIKNARVAIKHKSWDEARGFLDGALVPFLEGVESLSKDEQQEIADSLSYALKIVINSVYGLTSASFPNAFKDPRNVDNVVAKRGALFMIALKYEVLKRGFVVAHIKTDSIKIPNATPEIIQFVMDFGKKYGYTFEHEATYAKMCLVNKSTYIAKYDEYGERTKGGKHANCWTATGAEFQHPYIFKTLFSHDAIEFNDLCETKSVSDGAAIYLDMNEDMVKGLEDEVYSLKEKAMTAESGKMELRRQIKALQEQIDGIHNLVFIGKCGSFCPISPGFGGGLLVRVKDGKGGAVGGTKGYRWLESEKVLSDGLEKCIDKVYFRNLVDDAYKHIGEYGDADEFVNG